MSVDYGKYPTPKGLIVLRLTKYSTDNIALLGKGWCNDHFKQKPDLKNCTV